MKLHTFNCQVYKEWISFIPTIEIHINDPRYMEKNFAVVLSIFIWHFRWLFVKDYKYFRKEDINNSVNYFLYSPRNYGKHFSKED